MVKIPKGTLSPTIEKIYQSYVDRPDDWRRDHLGASQIGGGCLRALWYTFRWCSRPQFGGRMLRLFDTGKREEGRLIKELRNVGVTVYDKDPGCGLQVTSHLFGGHFGGSLDAVAIGFEEAPKTFHVCEMKTSNTRDFEKLERSGVKKVKPQHFAQMQVYMILEGLERAYYFCVCKETDEIYGERVEYDAEFAKGLVEKARRIVFSQAPLFKITDDPDLMDECKWCTHRGVCFENRLPEISCRTCAWVTPGEDGSWICDQKDQKLSSSEQRHPCEKHIYIPDLIPLQMVKGDSETGRVEYAGGIVNGPGAIASKDLQAVIDGKGLK